jgi:ribosomal protein S18 acetylase RimI-like enzyme
MLLFRPASLDDVDAIVELVTSAYRGDSSRSGWTTEAELIEGPRTDAGILATEIVDPGGLVLVGVDGEAILACCHLERRSETVGYFGMFAVSPTRQGGGLGKQVMAEAERICRDDWGLTSLEMTVLEPREELIAFYERRGFVRTGTFEPFPYGDPRFGTPRSADLRFTVLRKPL